MAPQTRGDGPYARVGSRSNGEIDPSDGSPATHWRGFPGTTQWPPPAVRKWPRPGRRSSPHRRPPQGDPAVERDDDRSGRTRDLRRGGAATAPAPPSALCDPRPPRQAGPRAARLSRHLGDGLEIVEEDGFSFP